MPHNRVGAESSSALTCSTAKTSNAHFQLFNRVLDLFLVFRRNAYSLLDTQRLLDFRMATQGSEPLETQMILN